MEVAVLERNFVIERHNEKINLDDVNPNFSNDQIMEHYSGIYPELTNANIEDKGIVGGKNLIVFKSIAGKKG